MTRVRIVEPGSVFFGREGAVLRAPRPGQVDPAYSVRLDAADGPTAPLAFRPREVEEIPEKEERG